MIQLPTEYFVQLEKSGYETGTRQVIRKRLGSNGVVEKRLCNSPEDRQEYLAWLASYIERIYGEEVRTMEIGTNELVFQNDRSVLRKNVTPIAKFSQQ